VIYPLGSTIVIKNLMDDTQAFLQRNGHNSAVSCIALSRSGKYLASGQVSHMGFPAPVIIWDLETYEIVHKLVLHKGKVQDLCFSYNEKYIATLGGRDDNKLVIWDVETGQAICGSPASSETASTVRFCNTRDDQLVTAGNYNLKVWAFDRANRKLRATDCNLGQLKRSFTCLIIDDRDEYMYCGTKTGDVLKVNLNTKLFKESGPEKRPFSLGVSCVLLTARGNVIVGCGDGTIAILNHESMRTMKKIQIEGDGITSLTMNAARDHFFFGTNKSNIYLCAVQSLQYELRNTCHSSAIRDVVYPHNFSELFATCGGNDIRIWNSRTRTELLRIHIPNVECLCVAFAYDGKSIVSGWDDGKIRAFKPQSGKLLYVINDAHIDGVTALALTKDGTRIVSGGQGGQVRVWAINGGVARMIASMKEHKACVNSLQLNNTDTECVSASADGSCIVWSLERFARDTCLFASTQFKAVVYHPDQSQVLTTGSDRKLAYWDVIDGTPIRVMDGSKTDVVTTLAITPDGSAFVSGGADRLVKVWHYDEGFCHSVGTGHSGAITKATIAPDQNHIVTVGEEGAIFIWRMPKIVEDADSSSAPEAAAAAAAGAYDLSAFRHYEQEPVSHFVHDDVKLDM